MDDICILFNTTYNRLSESYCDALFRRSEDITTIEYEQMSPPNSEAVSRVRFYLTFSGICHGCSDGEPVLIPEGGSDPSRFLKEADSDLCFCGSSTVADRAPTKEEFEAIYRDVWREASGRILGRQ